MRRKSKSQRYFILYIVLFLMILTSPFWIWQLFPEHKLNVLIIDKTVTRQSFREHQGLTWVLNNQKYVKDNGGAYSVSKDFLENVPNVQKEQNQFDVIYLADQYGVHGNEGVPKNKEENPGRLTVEEIDALENRLHSNSTLIAEFNTFASPTKQEAREKISNILNVTWTGWTGRYFSNLASDEIPDWLKKGYQDQYNKKWTYNSSGFVFIHENGFIKVLDRSELEGEGVHFSLTEEGKRIFKGKLDSDYNYWFDIITPRNEEEVLAQYSLPIGEEARDDLKQLGIPTEFPAVIQHKKADYTSYYFAGDYADEPEVPQLYQTVGFSNWKKYMTNRDSFYWSTYVPMMKELLKNGLHQPIKQQLVEVEEKGGLMLNSTTNEKYLQVLNDGKWEDLLIKGVNMGIAKPGYFPGETAITKEEYLRWFHYIGNMNANAIRVYTIHPPAFYEAFYEYNRSAEKPLYLFHGVWMNEEDMVSSQNVYDPYQTEEFKKEINRVVDIIHGNATLPVRQGHASGTYTYDISPYVLGYMIGTEWDPEVVAGTNEKNSQVQIYDGTYFYTENASPFESWLAGMMDSTINYEASKYNWQHSISFTNWVTTDLLEHPSEPSENEDMVSINPNHIKKKDTFQAGMFASYHIYPYYPDFLNYEEKYLNYKDSEGKNNNYEAYLKELRAVHDMPVLVAEFGVPSSRGLTHVNPFGMNQGKHSEQEQGEIDSKLFQSIVKEDYAGGLVFTWQDEWFKRTWNTMDYDNPDRRPYWNNMQTNEQHFGLLSFDPGVTPFYPDGLTGDWELNQTKPFYETKDRNSLLQKMFVASDSGYLYIRLDYSKAVDWQKNPTYLLFDTISGQGQRTIQLDQLKLTTNFESDFVAELSGPKESRIMVDSYYDSFYYQYGELLKMIPRLSYASKKDNGIFHPIRLALNKEFTIPSTLKKYPFQSYETGKLTVGNGNPESNDFNSLTDMSMSKDQKTIEIRLPWQLINVKDPSEKEAIGDLWKNGMEASVKLDGIKIAAFIANKDYVIASLPDSDQSTAVMPSIKTYEWTTWNEPAYTERLKKSYYMIQQVFQDTTLENEGAKDKE